MLKFLEGYKLRRPGVLSTHTDNVDPAAMVTLSTRRNDVEPIRPLYILLCTESVSNFIDSRALALSVHVVRHGAPPQRAPNTRKTCAPRLNAPR